MSFVVDSGCCENVVASCAVEKLKFPCVRHPTPHNLSWFKKGNEQKVNTRCLVPLSIGNKMTRCSVISCRWMCHNTIGQALEYDRNILHDEFKNTYTFGKDNVKILRSTREGFPIRVSMYV